MSTTNYSVLVKKVGDEKVKAIKILFMSTDAEGLKGSKYAIEHTPLVINSFSKENAEALARAFNKIGTEAEVLKSSECKGNSMLNEKEYEPEDIKF